MLALETWAEHGKNKTISMGFDTIEINLVSISLIAKKQPHYNKSPKVKKNMFPRQKTPYFSLLKEDRIKLTEIVDENELESFTQLVLSNLFNLLELKLSED